MSRSMRKCPRCVSYTFKETCPHCNVSTQFPKPPKFSPEDKYAKYRRLAKEQDADLS